MACATGNEELEPENEQSIRSICQMCFSIHEELKSLFSCGHNLCNQCLKTAIEDSEVCLHCPLCSEKCPKNGEFSSNSVIKEACKDKDDQDIIVTNKKLIDNLQKNCTAKVQKIEEILFEIDRCKQEKLRQGNQLRGEIHETADGLVEMIRKQERQLCEKLEENVAKDVERIGRQHKLTLETLLQKSKHFTESLEAFLNGSVAGVESDIKNRILSNSVEVIGAKLYPSGVELTSADSNIVTFDTNRKLVEKLVKDGIGKLVLKRTAISAVNPHRLSRMLSVHFKTPEVLLTLKAEDLGLESFSPISLASDKRSRIAVADPENYNILLLDKNGNLQTRFTSNRSGLGPATFSGLSFTREDEILAVHGSTHLHFINPKNGRFRLSYKTSPKHGVKYCFVSCDDKGRVIVTCEPAMKGYRACVCVYSNSPFGEPELKFGFSGANCLEFPFRALCHKGSFFVSDMEKGCIMVYNSKGNFVRQFGSKERGHGELVLPIGIAIDSLREIAYVCDWGSNSLQVYNLDGSHVFTYTVEGRPTDVALLEDNTVVLCSKDDKWVKFLFLP